MAPLLAFDIGEILKALIPLVVILFFVLRQVMAAPERPVAPPKRARPPQKPAHEEFAEEIEVFLKRAAQQRKGKQPAEVEVLEPGNPPALPSGRGPLVVRSIEPIAGLSKDDETELVDVLPSRGSVAAHVAERLGGDEISEHATHLGEDVGETDERMEARLHTKFDHRLGQLARSPSESPYETSHADNQSTAGETEHVPVADLFKNPDSIRKAIIFTEIIRRPEDRW